MSILLLLVGLAFLIPGILSVANITDVFLGYVSMTNIHTLTFLSNYPSAWIYIVLGLLLIFISRRL